MKNKVEFKVWDGNNMTSWKLIKETYGFHHWIVEQPKGIKLLQYVQAKDIKGKKIFEGDIIQSEKHGTKYIVRDLIEFQIWCYSNSIDTYLSYKIIGNIYENKNILKN